ncbi:uncharacterized protein [Dermacentor andersoni]|uniref:uncharacterized protein n=1 Tax=Dermacentor andersoni TaxID=34620 RepID=UPI0021558E00
MLQARIDNIEALASEIGLSLNPNKCRSLHLSGAHPVGTRPSIFRVAGASIPAMADFDAQKFLGRPVGFRVLTDDVNIIDQTIQRGTALLTSLLAPWQRMDAIRTFVFPGLNFMMRCGTLGKDDWQRLDDELRPLLKRTLYLPSNASKGYLYGSPRSGAAAIPLAAELSDLCRVDNAFNLLTSADFEVRDMASQGLFEVVSTRLRRPVEQRDFEDYLSGSTEGDFRAPASQLRSAWTEARKASRRLDVLWQLVPEGIRIICGEKMLTSSHRKKVIRTLHALQSATRDEALYCKPNQGKVMQCVAADPVSSHFMHTGSLATRDEALYCKPNQGKVMQCVAADPVSSHFMHTGSFTRFADWRFIHKAKLNLLPLNGASPWITGRDQRFRVCGYEKETLPHVLCHCMTNSVMYTAWHNSIVARLRTASRNRFTITYENRPVGNTNLRPDLVMVRGEAAIVLDVYCPFDNRPEAFSAARAAKDEPVRLHLAQR